MGNKNIVLIGLGETGAPIKQLEEEAGNNVTVVEIDNKPQRPSVMTDVMHVCIGDSDTFVSTVLNYIDDYNPVLVIIHSTIAPGKTSEITEDTNALVVHSPIRGVHPNLYKGIKTFVKNIGGDELASTDAYRHLTSLGLKCNWMGDAKNTEHAKILSTTYYGWNILFAKLVNEICEKEGLDYAEVYTNWNAQYNIGYIKLGMQHVVRPVLTPPIGVIGGHCISQNFELLPDTELKKIVKELNEKEI